MDKMQKIKENLLIPEGWSTSIHIREGVNNDLLFLL